MSLDHGMDLDLWQSICCKKRRILPISSGVNSFFFAKLRNQDFFFVCFCLERNFGGQERHETHVGKMQQQLQALFLQCALGGSPYGALLHQNQQQQQQQQQTQALQSLQHLSLQPHTLGALAGLVGGADVAGGLGGAAGSSGISGISSSLFDQVQLISLLAQQQQQQQQHQQQQYVQQQQVQAQQAQAQQQEGVAATRQVPDQLLQIQQEILLRQILQSVTPAQMQVCSISPISCTGVTQTISRLLRISTSLQDEVHKQLPQAAIQKNGERLISHSDIE